jgi:hypothetical protein
MAPAILARLVIGFYRSCPQFTPESLMEEIICRGILADRFFQTEVLVAGSTKPGSIFRKHRDARFQTGTVIKWKA